MQNLEGQDKENCSNLAKIEKKNTYLDDKKK